MPDETPRMSAKEYRQQAGSATSEREHQEQVIEWAEAKQSEWPELGLIYHVPNSHHPGAKPEPGLRAGVPDLSLPVPQTVMEGKIESAIYHGLYIEMKRPGGQVREEQTEWLDALREQGYRAVVCYGADEAIRELTNYLGAEDA